MALHTDEEKLREVERLLDEERRHRGVRNSVLAAVAADIRATMGGAAGEAERELERRLAARGNGPTAMVGVAEDLVGRWPVVRAALRRRALSRSEEVKAAAQAMWQETYGECAFRNVCAGGRKPARCDCMIEAVDLAMIAAEAIDRARLSAETEEKADVG